ncbi:MAG: hypothetical protein CVU61_17585 [Deltaproteobacteria bacterium HGW-Deltaproteobacteria-19]|jgi:hypothetical protein|nr:MAG: hypothetical protein CVU61_17585 [Deltaproteobacteria bacterium HGW-Deltaproteobacteria-19]
MKVMNIHERNMKVEPVKAGGAIDGLSGREDFLWPRHRWPAMEFDGPLAVGASGGHGPVRYSVTEYVPGRRVEFRFSGTGLTAGLDGRHFFEVIPRNGHVVLRHVVDAECDFKSWMKWQLLVGPLHDALLEDALAGVDHKLADGEARLPSWSPWVRFLRWMLEKKRQKASGTPH